MVRSPVTAAKTMLSANPLDSHWVNTNPDNFLRGTGSYLDGGVFIDTDISRRTAAPGSALHSEHTWNLLCPGCIFRDCPIKTV